MSVEQGDIIKLCFCVSEKVYLGYTAATKSCYPKKEKMESTIFFGVVAAVIVVTGIIVSI